MGLLVLMASATAWAQAGNNSVAFISVCSDGTLNGTSGSCPALTTDTHQMVVGPDGATTINALSDGSGSAKYIADEHSSILPPGYFPDHPLEYLFFAAGAGGVLKSYGPNANGQWQLGYASEYGYYGTNLGNGPVFAPAMQKQYCPTVSDPTLQDPTFDLNYAGVAGVFKDPTNPGGNLLMVYEGTNRCIGLKGGSNLHPVKNSFYSTIGIATSNDEGHTWPDYRYLLNFFGDLQYPLPYRNPCHTIPCVTDPLLCTSQEPCFGPNALNGALGNVCMGNFCNIFPGPTYGRYAVFSPPETIEAAIKAGQRLNKPIGYQAPSGFLDDARGDAFPYLYIVAGPMLMTREQLNGATAPLTFTNWYQGSFSQPGMGGSADSISFLGPQGRPQNCEAATGQRRLDASISYVDQTQQYLLLFVCGSDIGDPATQSGASGAAWFYSTNSDLSHQDRWSLPQEIIGSWVPYDTTTNSKITCADYDGWYPTLMSLNQPPTHLATSGYAFYMHGCLTGTTPNGGRKYSTRAFTINWRSNRAFEGIDTQHVYVLGSNGNLWLEHGPYTTVPPARQQVDADVTTFQSAHDGTGNVLVLDMMNNLWLESPPFGTVPPARQQVDGGVRAFQSIDSSTVFVLGNDGTLWFETGPFSTVPPSRQTVDANVRDFHALSANKVLVLSTDGNLWIEQTPFGTVPPARVQVDGNVLAFQKAPGSDNIFVLGSDGNLWQEQPPFGSVPPTRVQVDGNVRSFQAMDSSHVFVLGSDRNLWLEQGPFGVVPPARQQVDARVKAFQALDLLHLYTLDVDSNLWLESAPFGAVPPARQQVDGDVD